MSLILSAAVNVGSAYNIHESGFVLIIIKMITKSKAIGWQNAKQDIEMIMIALST